MLYDQKLLVLLQVTVIFGFEKHPMSKILVSTGLSYNIDHKRTEVINLDEDSKDTTCNHIEDFPFGLWAAIGSYLGSFPLICGGTNGISTMNQCHRLESGIWQPFTTLGQRRHSAAGIVYAKTFVIFGGYSKEILNSTEIVTEEGQVTQGPQMPVGLRHHSIARMNSTTSIIIGGETSSDPTSPLTWFFNHVSQEFQPGPTLITGRWGHATATLQDQDTKEEIVAVVGGREDGVYQDSTELLINGEWTQGPKMPKGLKGLSAVSISGNLYAFAGLDENVDFQTAIYRLSCSSRNCVWTTMDQELTIARDYAVAMVVPNDICS